MSSINAAPLCRLTIEVNYDQRERTQSQLDRDCERVDGIDWDALVRAALDASGVDCDCYEITINVG